MTILNSELLLPPILEFFLQHPFIHIIFHMILYPSPKKDMELEMNLETLFLIWLENISVFSLFDVSSSLFLLQEKIMFLKKDME